MRRVPAKGLCEAKPSQTQGRAHEVLLESGTVRTRARAVQVLLDQLVLDDAQGLEHIRICDELLLERRARRLVEAAEHEATEGRLELRSQARVRSRVSHGSSRVRPSGDEPALLHASEDALPQPRGEAVDLQAERVRGQAEIARETRAAADAGAALALVVVEDEASVGGGEPAWSPPCLLAWSLVDEMS